MGLIKLVKLALLEEKNQKRRKDVLTEFIQNIYTADSLSPADSKNNLEQAVVELVYSNGQHAACGLLITTDGSFITCHHCIEGGISLDIVLASGKQYPVKKVCAFSKKYDIALVKAEIPELSQAYRYRFFVNNQLNQAEKLNKDIIVVLTRWNRKLIINGGLSEGHIYKSVDSRDVNNKKKIYANQAHFQIKLKAGDSGGVAISSLEKRVYGVHSCGDNDDSLFVLWHNVMELIIRYTHSKVEFE